MPIDITSDKPLWTDPELKELLNANPNGKSSRIVDKCSDRVDDKLRSESGNLPPVQPAYLAGFQLSPRLDLHSDKCSQELYDKTVVQSAGGMTKAEYLARFRALQGEMFEITRKKNNDYGGPNDPFKNFREFGSIGFLVRMSDKFARLKTALVEKREFQVSDESLKDTLIDLANYSLLLQCWLEANNDRP